MAGVRVGGRVRKLAVVRAVLLGIQGSGDRDLGVEIGDPLVHHCWNAVLSSSSGTSIMVTKCPLFTTWVLAASFPAAILVLASSLWGPRRLSVWGTWFQKEVPLLTANEHLKAAGWARVVFSDASAHPFPSTPSEPLEVNSLRICPLGPTTREARSPMGVLGTGAWHQVGASPDL